VHTTADGRAYLKLGDGEVRDSVVLGEHDQADRIPALDSLVLHFDFYGRLTAIEVTGAAAARAGRRLRSVAMSRPGDPDRLPLAG
jgi:hypothetical protein